MTLATSTTRWPLRASAALGATLIVGTATAVAVATGPEGPPSVTVSYQDLNLATEKGTLALYTRIESAADKVCRISDIRNLAEVASASACRAQAIERAVREVNNPRLAAVYSARHPQG